MRQLSSLRLVTFVSLLAAISVSPAVACLWDRDTLAMEAKGLPGVVEVITGRFFRPPPEFYEMRLERVEGEIDADPAQFDLYDDAAVACDRLGRGDEALAWMERKRAAMHAAIAADGDIGEHEYRFHANIGTFYIHRWLRGGANRGTMEDAELARDHIGRAIEINPDAHFGREAYQLLAIEWLMDPPMLVGELPSILDATPNARSSGGTTGWQFPSESTDPSVLYGIGGAVEGLSGLIVLGNAWESFDVYYALGLWLDQEFAAPLALLAKLRCEEILEDGGVSLYPASRLDQVSGETGDDAARKAITYIGEPTRRPEEVEAYYREARAAAEEWHALKTEYMLAKLDKGLHPDTDPAFWEGFDEPAPPRLPGTATLFLDSHMDPVARGILTMLLVFVVIVTLPALLILRVVRRGRARQRALR